MNSQVKFFANELATMAHMGSDVNLWNVSRQDIADSLNESVELLAEQWASLLFGGADTAHDGITSLSDDVEKAVFSRGCLRADASECYPEGHPWHPLTSEGLNQTMQSFVVEAQVFAGQPEEEADPSSGRFWYLWDVGTKDVAQGIERVSQRAQSSSDMQDTLHTRLWTLSPAELCKCLFLPGKPWDVLRAKQLMTSSSWLHVLTSCLCELQVGNLLIVEAEHFMNIALFLEGCLIALMLTVQVCIRALIARALQLCNVVQAAVIIPVKQLNFGASGAQCWLYWVLKPEVRAGKDEVKWAAQMLSRLPEKMVRTVVLSMATWQAYDLRLAMHNGLLPRIRSNAGCVSFGQHRWASLRRALTTT